MSEGRLWTPRRQALSNALPLGALAGGLARSAWLYQHGVTRAEALVAAGFGLVLAWLAVGLFGLIGNSALKREMGRRWHDAHPFDQSERYFVGCARPAYRSALDPHEDVGWLVLHDDRVEFFGSMLQLTMDKAQVAQVVRRANPHSWLGFGGWVSLEAQVKDKGLRLLVEPREAKTLWGNSLVARRLVRRLRDWRKA